jgi:hypothetical protein
MQAAPASASGTAAELLPAVTSSSGSALVRADVPLSVANVEWNGRSISVVVSTSPTGGSIPVAAIVVDRSGPGSTRVSLLALSLPEFDDPATGVDAAKYEYLYTLAFRQEADARYCSSSDASHCEDSQGMALRKIARQRQCALAKLPEGARKAFRGWRVVALNAASGPSGGKPLAAVRVSDGAGPITGARIMFSQRPDSSCTAISRADGIASCELTDDHGHEGDHSDFDREPVVVTFPGDLRGDPILLPMTELLAR